MRIPRITIDMMVAVVALAQKKTMEQAGKDLGLSPSAVYKRVQAASAVLGSPLFLRTENGMVLTDSGKRFYPDAVKALEETLLAEDKALSLLELESGRLIVGHSTYLPPRILTSILKLRLEDTLGIRIQHIPLLTSTAVQRVADGTIHAGFGYLPVWEPDLISYALFEEPVVVCMPSTHSLAAKPSIRPQDIDGEPFIAVAREPLPAMHREIEEFFAGFGVSLRIAADAFGPPEAVTMVEHNMGICILGASAVFKPSVVGKPLTPRKLFRRCGLFFREDNRHPTLKVFVDRVLREMSGFR
jgi:LysR family transcriptional regulator, benzoate and cis,cis-muconate-responsive activator of ben and cat genes